jgi:Ni/Co efflux regulator RcnB
MKRVLLTFMVIVAGLAMAAPDAAAQSANRNGRTDKGQSNMDAWQKDMAEFRARSDERRHIQELTDSIASVQAFAAVKNQDFVLEAQTVQFRNGATVFVNDMTNFISVKGNRAVVQISPSNFAAGPNGVGGVTVDGMISGQEYRVGKKGYATYSFNVMGIGINAQVEIYLTPGTNQASATIYPNFNSNTVWLQGNIVPYENSRVIEGSSL